MSFDYMIPIAIAIYLSIVLLSKGSKTQIEFKYLILVLVIYLVPKYEVFEKPFYGLEYEDAYTFQVDSKDMSEHIYDADPFRIQINNYDIEKKRSVLWSYNGHYTAFSSILGLSNAILGYDHERAIQANLIFAYLINLLLFILLFNHTRSLLLALIPVLVLSMSPGTNLFQTSALTETFSALSIIVYITAFIKFLRMERKEIAAVTFLIFSLLMCILIKRENMVLFITLPFILHQFYKFKNAYGFGLLSIIILMYFIFVQPFSAELQESKSLNRSTFDLEYILIQFPVYLKSLLHYKEYGIGLLFCILSFVVLIIKKIKLPKETILISIVLLAYIFTYCFHYRSSYFVETGYMGTFETYRYANNFFILIPMIIGFNLFAINETLKLHNFKQFIFIIVFGVYAFSLNNSFTLRALYSDIEYQNRFSPIKETIKLVETKNILKPILVSDIAFVAMVLATTPFEDRIQEFRPKRDYFKYLNKNEIFYLMPEKMANRYFSNDDYNVIKALESEYVLFQLK